VTAGQNCTKKGLESLIQASVVRGDEVLTSDLQGAEPGTKFVHPECRKRYTDKRRLVGNDQCASENNAKRLRSGEDSFQWKGNYFLCGEVALDNRHPNRTEIYEVRTLELRERFMKLCEEREHPWNDHVRSRLHGCHDLVAVEARYHSRCFV